MLKIFVQIFRSLFDCLMPIAQLKAAQNQQQQQQQLQINGALTEHRNA